MNAAGEGAGHDDALVDKALPKKKMKTGEPNIEETQTTTEAIQIKGIFLRDLEPVMYGYGDDREPRNETVELVEDILIDYLSNILHKALDASAQRGRIKPGQKAPANALNVDDILHIVRRDPKKYARVQELLLLQEEIKKAKQIVEMEQA